LLRYFLEPNCFDEYAAKITQISDHVLREIIAEIPWEWLPHASDREALEQFLITRRDMTNQIVTCLSALIPDKNRGTNINKIE
jgi:hypothetical protein